MAARVASVSVSATRNDEQTVRRELEAWYGKVVAAYKKKDAKAYAALFAPDAKVQTWDGKTVDRKGLEGWARKEDMPPLQAIYSAREDIHKLTLKG
jgi:hypothetical protein